MYIALCEGFMYLLDHFLYFEKNETQFMTLACCLSAPAILR
jgi:hypothetical protein